VWDADGHPPERGTDRRSPPALSGGERRQHRYVPEPVEQA
jgi:hypothetical protein